GTAANPASVPAKVIEIRNFLIVRPFPCEDPGLPIGTAKARKTTRTSLPVGVRVLIPGRMALLCCSLVEVLGPVFQADIRQRARNIERGTTSKLTKPECAISRTRSHATSRGSRLEQGAGSRGPPRVGCLVPGRGSDPFRGHFGPFRRVLAVRALFRR